MVEYGSRGGGRTSKEKENFLTGGLDYYLIAHHNSKDSRGNLDFTCHKEVTPHKFQERLRASGTARTSLLDSERWTTALMFDVPFKGPARALSNSVVHFAIQRWANTVKFLLSVTFVG